jgi:hypothetical protein
MYTALKESKCFENSVGNNTHKHLVTNSNIYDCMFRITTKYQNLWKEIIIL